MNSNTSGNGSGNNSASGPQDQDNSSSENEVAPVINDDGKLVGYRCDEVVRENTVNKIGLIFYIDLASPIGQQGAAIDHMTEALAERVSARYGISDGLRCSDPPLDGTSWIVQFTAEPNDFKKVDLFDSCREYNFDETTQDCFVYEALVTGYALGDKQIPDVMNYVENVIRSTVLTDNTPFGIGFLGVPIVDPGASDAGRDHLGQPSNLSEQEKEINPNDDRENITIVGGLLVAAFCLAFVGIAIVLWRRRKAYLKDHHEMHRSLSKESRASDLQQYDTDPHVTISDEEADGVPSPSPKSHGSSPRGTGGSRRHHHHHHHHLHHMHPPALSSPTPTEENFPNNITFDLGTSFKDQLMGVHAGGGGSRRPNMGPFGTAPSADGTDSDADSWAQTDGTIGSLELQLEPITAEV